MFKSQTITNLVCILHLFAWYVLRSAISKVIKTTRTFAHIVHYIHSHSTALLLWYISSYVYRMFLIPKHAWFKPYTHTHKVIWYRKRAHDKVTKEWEHKVKKKEVTMKINWRVREREGNKPERGQDEKMRSKVETSFLRSEYVGMMAFNLYNPLCDYPISMFVYINVCALICVCCVRWSMDDRKL